MNNYESICNEFAKYKFGETITLKNVKARVVDIEWIRDTKNFKYKFCFTHDWFEDKELEGLVDEDNKDNTPRE